MPLPKPLVNLKLSKNCARTIKEQLENRAKAEYEQPYFDELIEMLDQESHDQVSPPGA